MRLKMSGCYTDERRVRTLEVPGDPSDVQVVSFMVYCSLRSLLKGEENSPEPGQINTKFVHFLRLFDFLFALYLFHLPFVSHKKLGLRRKTCVRLGY
jgi:hypothetical protein